MAHATVTLAQIRVMLQERYESTPFWTNEEARLAINEALRVWNALTGYWRTRATLQTIANDPWHPLTGSITYRTRVEVAGKPLNSTSLFSMDNHRPLWEGERTNSGGSVPTTVKFWMPAGLQLIALWPADAAGGQQLIVDGVVATPVLVLDGDFIDIGEEELSALLGYALHYLAFKIPAIFRATMPLYQAFIAAAADKNDRMRTSGPFRRATGLDTGRTETPIRQEVAR